jgi:hypothetical protein
MPRYVVLQFEVADSDTANREELEQQIEDLVAGLPNAPSSWTYEGGMVLDDAGRRWHHLT